MFFFDENHLFYDETIFKKYYSEMAKVASSVSSLTTLVKFNLPCWKRKVSSRPVTSQKSISLSVAMSLVHSAMMLKTNTDEDVTLVSRLSKKKSPKPMEGSTWSTLKPVKVVCQMAMDSNSNSNFHLNGNSFQVVVNQVNTKKVIPIMSSHMFQQRNHTKKQHTNQHQNQHTRQKQPNTLPRHTPHQSQKHTLQPSIRPSQHTNQHTNQHINQQQSTLPSTLHQRRFTPPSTPHQRSKTMVNQPTTMDTLSTR